MSLRCLVLMLLGLAELQACYFEETCKIYIIHTTRICILIYIAFYAIWIYKITLISSCSSNNSSSSTSYIFFFLIFVLLSHLLTKAFTVVWPMGRAVTYPGQIIQQEQSQTLTISMHQSCIWKADSISVSKSDSSISWDALVYYSVHIPRWINAVHIPLYHLFLIHYSEIIPFTWGSSKLNFSLQYSPSLFLCLCPVLVSFLTNLMFLYLSSH
jgi:hypothetical protein